MPSRHDSTSASHAESMSSVSQPISWRWINASSQFESAIAYLLRDLPQSGSSDSVRAHRPDPDPAECRPSQCARFRGCLEKSCAGPSRRSVGAAPTWPRPRFRYRCTEAAVSIEIHELFGARKGLFARLRIATRGGIGSPTNPRHRNRCAGAETDAVRAHGSRKRCRGVPYRLSRRPEAGMNFEFSAEELAFQREVETFLAANASPD